MKILFIASEIAPFAKTGGLADVAGSLPRALVKKGLHVSLVMPRYRGVARDAEVVDRFDIQLGETSYQAEILKTVLPKTSIPVYLIARDEFFDRAGIYNENGVDYSDNLERFAFFSRAALELINRGLVEADLIHANDWQSALAPVYIRAASAQEPKLARLKSLFTIHNLAYQGSFPTDDFLKTGLDWSYFKLNGMEFYDRVNLMKGGILFSDYVSTVSPTYAEEIQTHEFGCGLDGVLRQRYDRLVGVLNGVDYSDWSPDSDTNLPVQYTIDTVETDKIECKRALLKAFNLPEGDLSKPLFGVVSRLASQKGLDLLAEAIPRLISRGARFAVLGTGEPELEEKYNTLDQIYRAECGVRLEYDNRLAHMVQAGCDLFLMPSRYEPCGLTQMYALRYGSLPIVRNTGGLADTIKDVNTFPDGNGFVFYDASSVALQEACIRALTLYQNQHVWWSIVKRAMKLDFSWEASAHEYIKLYMNVLSA